MIIPAQVGCSKGSSGVTKSREDVIRIPSEGGIEPAALDVKHLSRTCEMLEYMQTYWHSPDVLGGRSRASQTRFAVESAIIPHSFMDDRLLALTTSSSHTTLPFGTCLKHSVHILESSDLKNYPHRKHLPKTKTPKQGIARPSHIHLLDTTRPDTQAARRTSPPSTYHLRERGRTCPPSGDLAYIPRSGT